MAGVRVHALDLNLTAPTSERERGAELTAHAEGVFIPRALGAMERRLRHRFGDDAIIRIETLRFRMSLSPSSLYDAEAAEVLGEDLAAQVEEVAARMPSGGYADGSNDVRIFKDQAQFDALTLIAAAEERPGPDRTKPGFDTCWRETLATPAQRVAHILIACEEAGGLTKVLARLGPEALKTLAAKLERLQRDLLPPAIREALETASPAFADRKRRPAHPGSRPEKRAPRDQPAPANTSAEDGLARDTLRHVPTPPSPAQGQEARKAKPWPDGDETPARVDILGSETGTSGLKREPATTPVSRPPDGSDQSREIEGSDPAESAQSDEGASFASEWCALLYLLNISLRLELPERLWRIGVDEGAALAGMLACLAGTRDDPATHVLSSAFPDASEPVTPPPGWARDELVAETLTDLRSRRGLDGLEGRIDELAAWFGAEGWSLEAWGAALHLAVAERMLGKRIDPGDVGACFARPGEIRLTDDRIVILQPIEAIDIDIRLAGLDANPGLLPWLDRRMEFVFYEPGDEP